MHTRWWLAAGLVVVLFDGSNIATAQDRPMVWKEGKIEIQFPGKPRESTQKNELGLNGAKLELTLDDGKVVYVASFTTVAGLENKAQHAELFNTTRDNLVKSLGGKLLSEKELQAAGNGANSPRDPGREFLIETPLVGVLRAQVYFVGDRLYRLMLAAPKEVVNGRDAETFFKSFKLVK